MSTIAGFHRALLILLCLFLLLPGLAFSPPVCQASSTKQLLILHSYHQGYKWSDDISRGIENALKTAGITARIHYEYMDTKRVASPPYFRLLYRVYRIKYSGTHFDAIVASDRDAFDFILRYRDQLFPRTPVIFCGVFDFQPSLLRGTRLITGVREAADFRGTLDLALMLHPKTRQIAVVNDTTTTGRLVHKELLRVIPNYEKRVRFLFLEDLTMPQLLARIQELPRDSLVLYTLFFRDKARRIFEYDESIALIAAVSPVPIYGTWDFSLGHGIVGGKLVSGYYQGKTAGELAARVLNGENIDNIPVVMNSEDHFMFDYRQLKRYGIAPPSLPPGSIIIEQPRSSYTLSRTVFWGGIAAFTASLTIILLLLVNLKMRRKAELALRRFAEELETRVAERTAELEQRGDLLERQNVELLETYRGLEAETAQRLDAMEELRRKDRMLIQQNRMAAVGEMLGNIAHQWRQPLNLLGLNIQEIKLSSQAGRCTPELIDTNLEKAMDIILRMSRIIDDFKLFSAPDSGKSLFSVNDIVTRTISLVEDSFQALGITIEFVSTGDPQCEGYPNGYGQVLMNLLQNAKDEFLERGTQQARITVRTYVEGEKTVLTLSDNAGGIDEAILHRVFDAFFTTKPAGRGTGIGLFISKAIIEKSMGGTLTVRNTGEGAEFRIEV